MIFSGVPLEGARGVTRDRRHAACPRGRSVVRNGPFVRREIEQVQQRLPTSKVAHRISREEAERSPVNVFAEMEIVPSLHRLSRRKGP